MVFHSDVIKLWSQNSKVLLILIHTRFRHLFYSIRNPKLETTGANTPSIKPLPSCTRTRFFVLQGTFGLAMLSKASLYGSNIRLFSVVMGMCSMSILYKTWTSAWSCCGVAVFKGTWRWSGQSADRWRKPRLLFTTRDIATKWTKDGSWQYFRESRWWRKKNETNGRRIESNRYVVVVVVVVEGKQ